MMGNPWQSRLPVLLPAYGTTCQAMSSRAHARGNQVQILEP
jgi:hypothetical protein